MATAAAIEVIAAKATIAQMAEEAAAELNKRNTTMSSNYWSNLERGNCWTKITPKLVHYWSKKSQGCDNSADRDGGSNYAQG